MTRFLIRAALAGLAISTLTACAAQAQAWVARHGMNQAQFQSQFDQYVAKGYRMTDVSGYKVNGTNFYAAIWEKTGGGAWQSRSGMSGSTYQSTFDVMTAKGYTPLALSAYAGRFAAIWDTSGGAWVARHGLSGTAYQSEFNKWTTKGYRLTDVSGYTVGGKTRYAAIWKKQGGPAWQARHGLTGSQYQAVFNQMRAKGYRPVKVAGYDVNGTAHYAAIWHKTGGAWVARHGLTAAAYQAEFNKWTGQGYRLSDVSAYTAGGSPRFAAIWTK